MENDTGKCTCKPGNNAGGWHEVRCDFCLEAEAQLWKELIKRARKRLLDSDYFPVL